MKYENNLFDLQGPIFKALQHYVMRSSMTALNPIECKSIHAQNDYLMILVKKKHRKGSGPMKNIYALFPSPFSLNAFFPIMKGGKGINLRSKHK